MNLSTKTLLTLSITLAYFQCGPCYAQPSTNGTPAVTGAKLTDLGEVKTEDFTAEAYKSYVVLGAATITDPAPFPGASYSVFLRSGFFYFDGVLYNRVGQTVRRSFHSGSWRTYAYPVAGSILSSDISDATAEGTANMVVKRGSDGRASFGSIGNGSYVSAVTGKTSNGIAGEFESGGGYGIQATCNDMNPNYHARFGKFGDSRSYVANQGGAYGWFRGAFTGDLSATATLTANRTWTLPDKNGTVAFLDDIVPTDPDTLRNSLSLPALQGFGFIDPSTVSITYTNTGNNVTLTVAPISPATTFTVFAGPTPKTQILTGAQTKTITGATSANYFFYYENVGGTMTLQAGTTPWVIGQHAPISYLTWDAVAQSGVFKLWEVHSTAMDDATHAYHHTTSGAKYVFNSGLDLIHNATLSTPASSGLNTMVGLTPGKFRDEDIEVLTVNGTSGTVKWEQDHGPQTIGSVALANGGVFPVTYYNGTRAVKTTSNARFPFLFTSNIPNYVDGSGAITPVTEDQRFGYWMLLTSDVDDPIILVPHRAVYNSLATAQAGMALTALPTDLQGIPPTEVLSAHRLIFRYNASGGGSSGSTAIKNTQLENATDFRAAQVALITGTAPNTASAVIFVPSGDITSTNVQSALEELDAEKASLAGNNTLSGINAFSSTTRPTSSGTGTPASSSLITASDGDSRYGLTTMKYRITDGSKASDTTYADDDVLVETLGVGIYEVDFATFFDCNGGTSGAKMQLAFTGVSDATKTGGVIETATGANSVVSSTFGATRPAGGAASTFTFPRQLIGSNSVFNMARGKIILHVTTAGTLSVQWAQNSSTTTPTLHYRSSYLKTRKL